MQTILGSGGAIGTPLARELTRYTKDIRLVSRNPVAVNPGDQLFPADLSRSADVFRAIEGSETVYLTVGFPYSVKVWEANWKPLVRQVISACEEVGSRLVFFDNVYMYDIAAIGDMTEDSPYHPPSRKGVIRAEIARMIQDAASAGRIQGLIARSADFYGPGIQKTSILTEMVFNNLAKGKSAFWLSSLKYRHSFTYTPDAARATAQLGNTPDAYGQVWHLPTAADPWTGKEWVQHIAEALGVKARSMAIPRWMIRGMGLFDPLMREFVEMMYQYDREYVFRSDKFERRFEWQATPYVKGVREVARLDYRA